MAKYSKGAQKKVESAMKRMEKGTLRSGRSGKKVTNPKQAIAIGLSEARKKGAKVPVKKKAAVKTKTVAKKRSVSAKAAPKKKVAPKKKSTSKASVKRTAPPKASLKKTTASSEPARKKKIPAKESLPPASELSEELVEKAAHTDQASREHIITAGNGRDAAVNVEDPVRSFDKHVFEKATVKGDPKKKLHLSSVSKRSIRPSGKKPLWRN